MKTTALGALVLVLPLTGALGALGACSSGDDRASAGAGRSASATPPTPARPAVQLVGHGGGVGTYCVLPGKGGGFPDFAWTGVRLAVHDAATVTGVSAQTQGVDLVHSWVVPGGNGNTGAFVPWPSGRTFLRKLDWAQRTRAAGTPLTVGAAYTLVVRLRPQDHPLPDSLQGFTVRYRSADGGGSVTDPDTLKFDPSC